MKVFILPTYTPLSHDIHPPILQGKTLFVYQEAYTQQQEIPEHKKAQLSRVSPELPTAETFVQGPFDL